MNLINLLENYIIPLIYFSVYSGLLIVILLILLRIKQLSLYQNRILCTISPELIKEKDDFKQGLYRLIQQFLKLSDVFLRKINALSNNNEKIIVQKLEKAGLKQQHSAAIFLLVKGLIAIMFSLIFIILNSYFFALRLNIDQPFLFFLIGLFVGLRWTEIILNKAINKYRENIKKALPDVIDLLIICIEAGYSNELAVKKMSVEFNELFPEIANEFATTYNELKVLPDRYDAWKNLSKRTELSEINAISSAFQQNDKYGTSITIALKNQLEMFRINRIISAEEKAGKIPVFLAIPLTIFFLPIIFIMVLSPALLKVFNLV